MAIQQEGITELSSLKSKTTELLKKRLEQLAKDRQEYEQAHSSRSESDFVLMGALMVKLDGTHINDTTQNGWYLYLRDYMVDDIGSTWRVIKGTSAHDDISSHQVLADLRGTNIKNDDGLECHPSPTSNDFRPVYLFYCNNDIVSRSAKDMMIDTGEPSDNQATENNESSITLADYAFGDDDGDNNLQYDEDKWDMDLCKYCGIGESIDNVNTIFFCDECNLGVHQLCEQPTIGAFEMDIDPWYCRDCSRSKGLPMPIPPPYLSSTNELQNSDTSMKKRKWDE
ncbi:hypothetical protein BC941DRAFT_348609 [Chlamydoabsidia padenii]|nr:hypothetical protein BC941DRAFT_348609 [Chlamydoabsidia padenii]